MEIKTASTEKDFADIRHIWEERFTTDNIWLNTLFQQILPLCRSYIYILEGKAVSAISLMPMKFVSPGTAPLKGFYLFGVATLQTFEGKRLAAKLILHASGILATEGYDFIFERPANQSLNKYYFNLGFTISLPKVPHRFQFIENAEKAAPFIENNCSPENTHRNPEAKTLSEAVLDNIRIEHPTRFEWKDRKLLEGLIHLGELREHIKSYSPTPNKAETYIAVKPLHQMDSQIFKETFFCFPME